MLVIGQLISCGYYSKEMQFEIIQCNRCYEKMLPTRRGTGESSVLKGTLSGELPRSQKGKLDNMEARV